MFISLNIDITAIVANIFCKLLLKIYFTKKFFFLLFILIRTLNLFFKLVIFFIYTFAFLLLRLNEQIFSFLFKASFLCFLKKLSSAFNTIDPFLLILSIISDFALAIWFKFLKFFACA